VVVENFGVSCLNHPLLADENVHPGVVAALRSRGRDVTSVVELPLRGAEDLVIVRHAHAEGRVVLTHDADFGTLAVRMGEPILGIVYLRPGHIRAEFTLEALDALETVHVDPPFVVVAERVGSEIRVRARTLRGA
jgi:predicted nuclease of predicted toxin-antitoxin system